MKVLAVIPARYASTRFPGKPLVEIGGKSMIQRVYEQAQSCQLINEVVVATDDTRIHAAVEEFGGAVMMTSDQHPSGTDRVAEVAAQRRDIDIIVNVQGDEPFIDPTQLAAVVEVFERTDAPIATLARLITTNEALFSPNVVKVVVDANQKARYFSRHPVPFIRSKPQEEWLGAGVHFQHIGIYAFRRAYLNELSQLPPGQLESLESLEQLRWLEAGYQIYVQETNKLSIGIDTPEDLQAAEAWLREQGLP